MLGARLPRDDGDNVAEADDQEPFDQPGLTNDPGEPEEQHHAPDVQQASHEDTFEPKDQRTDSINI